MTNAERIHAESIVFDAACPLAVVGTWYESWVKGGATAIAPTVAWPRDDTASAVRRITDYLGMIANDPRLMLIERTDQFHEAKRTNRMGIVLHFQTPYPFARDLSLVRMFHKLGVRMVQITYNVKNYVGDGCEERTDCGLSKFGIKLIKELNSQGIVVDLSHTGYRTTMEAMEVSEHPCVFSHSNPKAVHDSVRNITDDQIKAVAQRGGVIGLNATAYFVAKKTQPTMKDLVAHVKYIADLVGIDYIGVGLDYYEGMSSVASDEEAWRLYNSFVAEGVWAPPTYVPPPWPFPREIRLPENLPNLTVALAEEGFHEEEIKKVLGLNFLRVFEQCWK
jgi:membrane dipeptidase